MSLYARCLRPLLFRGDPERMHDRAIETAETVSRRPGLCTALERAFRFDDAGLAMEVAGMNFRHPIGLAAGFDKNGRGVPLWRALGFSHIEIGSVSAHFSAGNPKPRLFRVPEDRAIVVNYGLPNEGAARVAHRLSDWLAGVPVGVNLVNTNRGPGAAPDSDEAIVADYTVSLRLLEPVAGYLVLNLSCPNTSDGRAFVSDRCRVRRLLDAVAAAGPGKPVFLKVAPFGETAALEAFLEAVESYAFVRGFSINLPPGKPPGMTAGPERLRAMPGAVSGRPAEAAANRAIAEMYRRMDRKRYAIIGSGGVFTGRDAWLKLRLGASLVQVLTALVYEGPGIVRPICREIQEIARREGVRDLRQVVGSGGTTA